MLVGGTDVSGSEADGQQNHVALAVGKEDAINRIYNNVGVSPIHMSKMSERQRLQVRKNLDFSFSEIIVWRFHVNRRHIEHAIQKRIISEKNGRPESISTKALNRTGSSCSRMDSQILRQSFERSFRTLPLKPMPTCVPPSKTGISAINVKEGRTSCPMRWPGLTKGGSRYKTEGSWIYGTTY